jgi:NAD(P)H-flavin reductase
LLEPPAGKSWSPGERLVFWGPFGKPFNPPPDSHKWLLMAPNGHLGRLLPLVEQGLEHGISVATWATKPLSSLPPAVELLPSAIEGFEWADYVAVDIGEKDPSQIDTLPLKNLEKARAGTIEVLITPPMPCGFGGCGVCAVKGKRGWHLACLDGPVFDWKSLGR